MRSISVRPLCQLPKAACSFPAAEHKVCSFRKSLPINLKRVLTRPRRPIRLHREAEPDNIQVSHSFNTFSASSTFEYRFTAGSRASRSASSIAAIVS